jgi:N-acetylated-alpha-linked acidic dipeptidase
MSQFGDPTFAWHASLGQLWGVVALRLADSPLLPLSYVEYGNQLQVAVQKLQKQAAVMRRGLDPASVHPPQRLDHQLTHAVAPRTHESQARHAAELAAIDADLASIASDSGLRLSDLPLQFDALSAALKTMTSAAAAVDREQQAPNFATAVLGDPLALRRFNDRLQLAERCFLYLQGVPGREWYRHLIWVTSQVRAAFSAVCITQKLVFPIRVAPAQYNGYGSTAFSTIADAIFVQDWKTAQEQIQLISILVNQMADFLLAR